MATHHNHTTYQYNQKTLHIMYTPASNILLGNLSGQKSLKNSTYYGINAGFFSNKALNLAYSDGELIGASDNNWCGSAIIGWNGVMFRHYVGMPSSEYTNIASDLTTPKDGTWAQGGFGMYLGSSTWLDKLYADNKTTPAEAQNTDLWGIINNSRYRTGMVVDTTTKLVYMFVSSGSFDFAGFRAAIQAYLGITDGNGNGSTRYYGMFLDGGSSSQMKYYNNGAAVNIDPSNTNRKLFQIMALRDNT